jgi:hypothetical protein
MSYYEDIMKRIAAMQKQALSALTSDAVDAVHYWPHQQESFPYFVNRLGGGDFDRTSTGMAQIQRDVLMRMVVGHMTEGIGGAIAETVYAYMEAVEDFFHQQPRLTSAAYPTSADYVIDQPKITGDTGLVAFQNAGIETIQVGVEYTLELLLVRKTM